MCYNHMLYPPIFWRIKIDMYKIIEKHFYKKMQESLLNKLLFRGRFIGKRIRLLIGQIINIVAYNFLKLLLGLIFLQHFL